MIFRSVKQRFFLSSLLFFCLSSIQAQRKVTFTAPDGIAITADLYQIDSISPFIVLCHQAGFSRGEYVEIAPTLNSLGFNCLALDLRSGKECNNIANETAVAASKLKKSIDYLSAEQDIIAGIAFASSLLPSQKVILWGSSYSASLALKIASSPNVQAIIAFSPGEYFGNKLHVTPYVVAIEKPTWITSSKDEAPSIRGMMLGNRSGKVIQFVPFASGTHGSKALWKSNANADEYWKALGVFLARLKK